MTRFDETARRWNAAFRQGKGSARRWMRCVSRDATTFADIAHDEGCGERHIRFLAPLASLSPRIIAAIENGSAPGELTISSLVRGLPKVWIEQDAAVLG